MNHLVSFFKKLSIARIVCLVLAIVFYLWRKYLIEAATTPEPATELILRGPDKGLQLWQKVVVIAIIVAWLFNTIISLLISFKPSGITSVTHKNKFLLIIFYVIELITLPSFFISTYNDAEANLFTGNHPFWMDYIWGGNERTVLVSKLMTLSQCIFICCSICFLLIFWKVFMERKRTA